MAVSRVQFPKNRRAAISLTYDDGIENHHQYVAPTLEKYNLRGTFYTPLKSNVMQNPIAWRKLVERGHELGNHSVFHPCWSVGGKYADWLPDAFNLESYTPERWVDEMETANRALWLVDGKTERTFGNTCFDVFLGSPDAPVSLEELSAPLFLAARGEDTGRPVNMDQMKYHNLGTVWADRRVYADFAGELAELLDSGGWIIYTFHGVGAGTHTHNIDAVEHERLLAFLKENSSMIWTAPVIDVVKHLRKLEAGEKT